MSRFFILAAIFAIAVRADCWCLIPVAPCCWAKPATNNDAHNVAQPVVIVQPVSPVIGGLLPGEKCLGSAGYSWCASLSKCVRAWEEPCPTQQSVTTKCDALIIGYEWCDALGKCATESECEQAASKPVSSGGLQPGQQCLASAGYSWCDSKQKCLRLWEEPCDAASTQPLIGAPVPGEKCLASAGYSWCESSQKCIQAWAEACPSTKPQVIGGMSPGDKCLAAAGYSWCEAKQKCLRPWEEACS